MRRTIPLVLLLAGCSPDLVVPASVQLTCVASAECPDGWICDPGRGRCVAVAQLDKTPPALAGTPQLDRTLLASTMVATLTFDVSEVLRDDPEVVLHAGQGRALVKDPAASSSQHYVFTYTPVGRELEPEGLDLQLTVDLVDQSGNRSGAQPCGNLSFDFTAPAVLGTPVVTGSPARGTGEVVVTFEVDEALGTAPRVHLETGEVLSLAA